MSDREDVVATALDKLSTGKPTEDRRGRAARRDASAIPRGERAVAHPKKPREDEGELGARDPHHQAAAHHESTRANRSGPKRPAVWAEVPTLHSPEAVYGAYPKRFVPWALKMLGCERTPSEVLHVCSGALTREDVLGGTRVDIRPEAAPDIVADGRALPFPPASWRAVLLDPPYSVEYARDLYATEYPRPSHLLAEAARVVRPCGRIGILHFLVPSPPVGCRIVAVRGVTQGCGYRIRALTIYERTQDALDLGGA